MVKPADGAMRRWQDEVNDMVRVDGRRMWMDVLWCGGR